ncbi:hypothetical protein BD560DRAFT_426532 [Blakeslea trispora]|nr:hypothetical protein BD560DRAFT_426532 [Blakeslea trispora]
MESFSASTKVKLFLRPSAELNKLASSSKWLCLYAFSSFDCTSSNPSFFFLKKDKGKQEKKTSVNSSQSRSNKLSTAEKQRVLNNHAAIPEYQFWYLSTGACVNEKMKQLVQASIFEHPVHSLIFDPDNQTWLDYFSVDELAEIRTFRQKLLQEQ